MTPSIPTDTESDQWERRFVDARGLIEIATKTPLDADAIRSATADVRERGDAAWAVIEPLAGLYYPRVRAAILKELEADRMTTSPTPTGSGE